MGTKIESFTRDSEEKRLEEVVKTMSPEEREKHLEREATTYLNMVDRYSSDKRLTEKEKDQGYSP